MCIVCAKILVDFVVKEGPRVARLIQVCADISNPKTLSRELRALIRASQELQCDELWLLNDREDRTETVQWQGVERRIRLLPLWQWLMATKNVGDIYSILP